MKLTGYRTELLATPCLHCCGSGIEPGRGQLVCSLCGGVQYINAKAETEADVMFDDHDALRLCIKLLRKKDHKIKKQKSQIHRLEKLLHELQPFIDKKTASELKDKVYPPARTQERAQNGNGGYGD